MKGGSSKQGLLEEERGERGGVNKCFMSEFFLVSCAVITTDCHAEEPRKFLWSRQRKKLSGGGCLVHRESNSNC